MGNLGRWAAATLVLAGVGAACGQAPDSLAAINAYRAVDRAVRSWSLKEQGDAPPVVAAAVTLRLDGEIVGRGVDVAPKQEGDPRVVVLATRAAMEEAQGRVGAARDALFEETMREVARRITISLEVSGPWVPYAPEDWARASVEVEPGVQGVAVRMGERSAAMFPEAMLVTGTEPGAALSALVAKLSGDPTMGLKGPGELSRDAGVVFYRFETSHVAQPKAGATPEFLHRCGKVFDQKNLTIAGLRRWSELLAENLWYRRWPGPEAYGIMGTYDPVRGEYAKNFAGPREQALVAYAMLQYHHAQGGGGGEIGQIRAEIREWIMDLMREFARVEQGEQKPWTDPGASAITCAVLAMLRVNAATGHVIDDPVLVDLLQKCEACAGDAAKKIEDLDAATRLLMYAFARFVPGLFGDPEALRSELTGVPAAELPGRMPWVGWGTESLPPGFRAGTLRDFRELVWTHQFRAVDLPELRRDLAGAVLFSQGSAPMPAWNAARPLAYIATMLRDSAMTEEQELSPEISRLLASLRFLRQLTAGESEGHMYRNAAKAIGGVRASLWDQRMPPEATAMTLIAVCETIRSLEEIERRQRGAAGGQAP